MSKQTPPPEHLSPAARSWFSRVCKEYSLDETGEEIVRMAAELRDRAEHAREIVARDGGIINDRFGQPRENPAAKLERDSKIAFARLVRELGLASDESEPDRPPRVRS